MIKAKLIREERTSQFYIEVTFNNGNKDKFWLLIVEHCAKMLSDNELKEVYKQCNKQISEMDSDDVPFNMKTLMKELESAVINRKCYNEVKINGLKN